MTGQEWSGKFKSIVLALDKHPVSASKCHDTQTNVMLECCASHYNVCSCDFPFSLFLQAIRKVRFTDINLCLGPKRFMNQLVKNTCTCLIIFIGTIFPSNKTQVWTNTSHHLGSCWLTLAVKSESPAANYYFSSNTNDKQNLVICIWC